MSGGIAWVAAQGRQAVPALRNNAAQFLSAGVFGRKSASAATADRRLDRTHPHPREHVVGRALPAGSWLLGARQSKTAGSARPTEQLDAVPVGGRISSQVRKPGGPSRCSDRAHPHLREHVVGRALPAGSWLLGARQSKTAGSARPTEQRGAVVGRRISSQVGKRGGPTRCLDRTHPHLREHVVGRALPAGRWLCGARQSKTAGSARPTAQRHSWRERLQSRSWTSLPPTSSYDDLRGGHCPSNQDAPTQPASASNQPFTGACSAGTMAWNTGSQALA